MNDNSSVKGAITSWGRICPDEHPHTTWLAIRRRGEISIVCSSCVLSVQDHSIIASPSCTVVVGFEITSRFVETEGVKKVMISVGCVKELGDGGISICSGISVGEIETVVEIGPDGIWSVVVEICSVAFKVCLGDGVIAPSSGVGGCASALPAEL